MPGVVTRYPVPGLRALKFVIDGALPGGVYATLHAGLHWQKAAIWVLLDLELDNLSTASSGPRSMASVVGIDVGGTFTDLYQVTADGEVHTSVRCHPRRLTQQLLRSRHYAWQARPKPR